MKVLTPRFAAALILTASLTAVSHAATFGLESLDLQYVEQGWGEPQANRSVDNHPIFIDGKRFEHGFGTHAVSTLGIILNGQAESFSAKVRPTRLTPNEQYTHISLWSLLCSPLLIGCDMTKLDDFTLNLLTNDEVLDVSQDELGRQAARISKQGSSEVWAKDLADGSKAVGLFNLGEETSDVIVTWADLGLAGKHQVRDLWRQLDLGKSADSFQASVPRHGVVLVKISGR